MKVESKLAFYSKLRKEIKDNVEGQYTDKSPSQIADIINNGWTEVITKSQVPVKKPILDAWGDPVMEADPDRPGFNRPKIDKIFEDQVSEVFHHDAIWRVIIDVTDAPNIITEADVIAAFEE